MDFLLVEKLVIAQLAGDSGLRRNDGGVRDWSEIAASLRSSRRGWFVFVVSR
ncbi:hypothetical protein [Thiomicrospira microaerophila]|uniref:hypothetical protein n=1 Tax=Thiomicrospira microaerophila TaxID=406020 RepID=UPI001E32BBBB|nr:hypothetical protein [Thiomicrospira microaerophila]